jgi:hypothetical protein
MPGFYSLEGEQKRQAINEWIRRAGEYDRVIDFDRALRDPEHPRDCCRFTTAGITCIPTTQARKRWLRPSLCDCLDWTEFIVVFLTASIYTGGHLQRCWICSAHDPRCGEWTKVARRLALPVALDHCRREAKPSPPLVRGSTPFIPRCGPHSWVLGTFSSDGGLTDTTTDALAFPTETPGHGRWVRTGRCAYPITFMVLIGAPDGSFAATGKVRANLTFSASGDEFNGVSDRSVGSGWGADHFGYGYGDRGAYQSRGRSECQSQSLRGNSVRVEYRALTTVKVNSTEPSRMTSPSASGVGELADRSATNVPFLLPRSSMVASAPDTLIKA